MPDESEPGATTAPRDEPPSHTVVQVGVPDAVRDAGALPAIPGYELHGEIGAGGMGVVYAARDLALNRSVAVKLLRHAFPVGGAAVQRFLDEAQITGQLQHPGIPPVHQVGTLADGRPFLVMKLIKGRTLHALLAERAAPADDRARFVAVFEQICLAVGYAHSRGVVHRDLKPANIMVGAFGEVQVMDWGLAKVVGAAADPRPDAPAPGTTIRSVRDLGSETQAGSVLGSLAFMPPEQAGGEVARLDPRSDVFGLGAVLCAVLTGQPPYTGTDVNEIHLKAIRGQTADAFARLDACGAEPELVALAKRCLATDPAERPADGGAVAAVVASLRADAERRARQAELDRVRTEGELEAARATAVEQRKRRRVQLLLLASVALLALAGGAFAWWEDRRTTAAKNEEVLRKGAEQAEDDRRKAHTEREVTAALAEMNALCDRGSQEIENPPRWRLTLAAARSANRRAAAALEAGPATDELRATFAGTTARLEREEFDCETAELCEAWFLELIQNANLRQEGGDVRPLLRRAAEIFARLGTDLDTAHPDTVVGALGQSRLRYQATSVLLVAALLPDDGWKRSRQPVISRVSDCAHPLQLNARAAHRQGTLGAFVASAGRALTSAEFVCLALTLEQDQSNEELLDEAIRRNPANLTALTFRGTAVRNVTFTSIGGPEVERVTIPVLPPRPGSWHQVPLAPAQVRGAVAMSNAIALRPDAIALWESAGEMYASYRLYDMAADHFRRAIAIDPTLTDLHARLANALMGAGRLTEAVAVYRTALAKPTGLAVSNAEPLMNAARCALCLAFGHEDGKGLTDAQRLELRLAALRWLREWANLGPRPGRDMFIARHDPALQFVRDPSYLDALPPAEAGRWVALWEDIRAIPATDKVRHVRGDETSGNMGLAGFGLAPPPREK